jgi:hypothetical protein
MIIWVHSQNSICANDCGLSQTQCFDFFSFSLREGGKGHVFVFNLSVFSKPSPRRVRHNKPVLTLAA